MASKNGLGILGGSGNGGMTVERSDPGADLTEADRFTGVGYRTTPAVEFDEDAAENLGLEPGLPEGQGGTGIYFDEDAAEDLGIDAGTGAPDSLPLTNGEREYVCELNLDFEDTGLISNFDFDWRQIREEDYDEETGPTRANQQTVARNAYEAIINADYDTGITPLRLQYFSEGEENNYFFSWEHGNATRPVFTIASITDALEYNVNYGDVYNISYESDELTMLSNKFSKDDFTTSIENSIQTIANNVYNRLNIVTNLNLEFNKNKTKEIKFKKLSRFEAQQTQDEQTETSGGSRSNLGSGTSGTSGGAY